MLVGGETTPASTCLACRPARMDGTSLRGSKLTSDSGCRCQIFSACWAAVYVDEHARVMPMLLPFKSWGELTVGCAMTENTSRLVIPRIRRISPPATSAVTSVVGSVLVNWASPASAAAIARDVLGML